MKGSVTSVDAMALIYVALARIGALMNLAGENVSIT
jgi:hypothetical protein